ncbi:MAG: YIP1 family protein [Candidatus Methanoperedens sp.]|nr:YIP1 family protein [Candidatus Methanoperedens sp.]
MDFYEKVKGFILEPTKTFDATKEDTLEDALKYYVGITAIFSALSAVLFAFTSTWFGSMRGGFGMMSGAGTGIAGAILLFVMLLILIVIGAFIGGAIVHIFVYIMGGRKGIAKTIIALMYGDTPYLLFGWIPLIGLIAAIWSLVLNVLGIRQFQELTTGKAILAILRPIIIISIIVFVAAMAAFMFVIGSSSGY